VSYIFEASGEDVWSPALLVGKLYVDTAHLVEEFCGGPSGLTAMAADYYEVDPVALGEFIGRAIDRSAGHPTLRALTAGFIATSLVMLDRAGHPHREAPEELRRLQRELAASMPT